MTNNLECKQKNTVSSAIIIDNIAVESNRITLFIMAGALFFAACSSQLRSFAAMQWIDKEGWPQQNELVCKVLLNDSLSFYHINITGRLKNISLFDSLSVIVQVTAPSGASFCDTVSFGVTHMRHRLWEDFRFPYCSHVRFSETGTWQFSFRQNMDVEVLAGVMAIGVFIKKHGEK